MALSSDAHNKVMGYLSIQPTDVKERLCLMDLIHIFCTQEPYFDIVHSRFCGGTGHERQKANQIVFSHPQSLGTSGRLRGKIDIQSVSYTHLDVYKRQLQHHLQQQAFLESHLLYGRTG